MAAMRPRPLIASAIDAVVGLVTAMINGGSPSPSARRLEIAWTRGVRDATWMLALRAAPREGAVIALCRVSTGESRRTLIIQDPLPPQDGDLSYHRGHV